MATVNCRVPGSLPWPQQSRQAESSLWLNVNDIDRVLYCGGCSRCLSAIDKQPPHSPRRENAACSCPPSRGSLNPAIHTLSHSLTKSLSGIVRPSGSPAQPMEIVQVSEAFLPQAHCRQANDKAEASLHLTGGYRPVPLCDRRLQNGVTKSQSRFCVLSVFLGASEVMLSLLFLLSVVLVLHRWYGLERMNEANALVRTRYMRPTHPPFSSSNSHPYVCLRHHTSLLSLLDQQPARPLRTTSYFPRDSTVFCSGAGLIIQLSLGRPFYLVIPISLPRSCNSLNP